ncbi:MAG: hypothetical protein WD766_02985 [Gemmatimonadota bacterium]
MKKLLIPFAVGAVLGLGGSSVAVGFFGGGDPSLTDSLAAVTTDTKMNVAHADSLAVGVEEAPDSIGNGIEPTLDLSDSIPAVTGAAGPGAAGGTMALPATNGTEAAMEPARLAKLFASMQAREAARVMEHMDDYEVQIILTQLGNREAAAILSNLTPERAAVISQTVIRGERSNQ